jgi:predicted RNA binding protein YcfA (HicA-like mRNA interferase family)
MRGLYVVSERIDPAGRVVTVEVHASQKSIGAAGNLRRMMEQAGQ